MSLTSARAAVAAAILSAAFVPPAAAHVTLEAGQAPADSYYKAVLRVPHGCEGTGTTRIRVQIPDGVTAVKPQPKAGWTLTIVNGKLAEPYDDGHGNKITEGVREVGWSGGPLPDAYYEEFVFRGKLPNAPGRVLYFPVVQDCEKGVHRWIEIPAAGKTPGDYKEPAPALTLTPKR